MRKVPVLFLLTVPPGVGMFVGVGLLPPVLALASSSFAPVDATYPVMLVACTAYTAAMAVLRWSRRRYPLRSAGESGVYVVLFGFVAPTCVAACTMWLGAVSGVAPDPWRTGLRAAITAVTMVPVIVSVARRHHRGQSGPVVAVASVSALVAGLLGVAAALDGGVVLVLVMGGVVVSAGLLAGRFATGLAACLASLGMSVAPATEPVANWTLASLLLFAALGLLLSAARTMPVLADTDVIRLGSNNVELPGFERYHARLSRAMRAVRWLGVLLLGLRVAAAEASVSMDPDLSVWLISALLGGGLVAVNIASHAWDATLGESPRRQRIEVAADAGLVVTMLLVLGPTAPYQPVPVEVVAMVVIAALRLGRRAATAVAVSTVVLLLATRAANGWLLWATMPVGHQLTDDVGLLLVLPILAYLVAAAVDELRRLHRDTSGTALALDAAQTTVLEQRRQLDAENVVIRRQRAELRDRVAQLDDSNARLTESRQRLEEFSSVVVHDLRSPIATALMLGQTIEATTPESGSILRERQLASLARATDMIDRLYRQARAATAEPVFANVDLNKVVRSAVDDLDHAVASVDAHVAQPRLLPRVHADPILLRQVFLNLLGNSLSHGMPIGHRGLRIEVWAAWGTDGVTVTVADNGRGLPHNDLDLFGPGVRGSTSEGLGLGLATAHRVVELHGGRIWSHPSPLGGAAISFVLPAPSPSSRRVLVVDADHATRQAFARAIRAVRNVEVMEAASIGEAVRHLEHGDVDAIIIDHVLPDGRSGDLLAHASRHAIPVHVVTDEDVRSERFERHRRLGAVVSTKREILEHSPRLAATLLGEAIPASLA